MSLFWVVHPFFVCVHWKIQVSLLRRTWIFQCTHEKKDWRPKINQFLLNLDFTFYELSERWFLHSCVVEILQKYLKKHSLIKNSSDLSLHRGAFCQFPFRWIYYYGSNNNHRKGNWQNAPLCTALNNKF